MLLGEVLSIAKIRLKNLAISKNDSAMISAINLGMSDLYRKFNLSIKSETVLVNTGLSIYDLRNNDVNMLIALYDRTGREMRQSDVLDSIDYDYKIVNYRQFLLRHPFDGYVFAIYKATNPKVKVEEDEIELPDAMIPALISYIGYVLESTTNTYSARGDTKLEPSFYWKIYTSECAELVNQGYQLLFTIRII